MSGFGAGRKKTREGEGSHLESFSYILALFKTILSGKRAKRRAAPKVARLPWAPCPACGLQPPQALPGTPKAPRSGTRMFRFAVTPAKLGTSGAAGQTEPALGSPPVMSVSPGHVPCHLCPCPLTRGLHAPGMSVMALAGLHPKNVSPPPCCACRGKKPCGPGQVADATAVSPSVTALCPPHLFIKGAGTLPRPGDPGVTLGSHRPSSACGGPTSHPVTPIPGLPPAVALCLSPVHRIRSISPMGLAWG